MRLFLAVDESHSIPPDEWRSILDKIEKILLSKKEELIVCEFTDIVENTFIHDKEKMPSLRQRDGGTLFQPFLNEAEKWDAGCVICFTDGYSIDNETLRYSNWDKMLWVLAAEHNKLTVGKIVSLADLSKEIDNLIQI